jgi:hypothetical protein
MARIKKKNFYCTLFGLDQIAARRNKQRAEIQYYNRGFSATKGSAFFANFEIGIKIIRSRPGNQ